MREASKRRADRRGHGVAVDGARYGARDRALFDGDAHVSPVAALAPVALILADAPVRADAGVLAALAWPLAVTALLRLAAALAARLGREVLLVFSELLREPSGGCHRGLAGLWRERRRRYRGLCSIGQVRLCLGLVGHDRTRLARLGTSDGRGAAAGLVDAVVDVLVLRSPRPDDLLQLVHERLLGADLAVGVVAVFFRLAGFGGAVLAGENLVEALVALTDVAWGRKRA